MTARVSLSLKAAQRLVSEHLQGGCCKTCDAPVAELRAAIAKATRASATRRKLKQPKAEKRATKRQRTKSVRALVMERAQGGCECGCGRPFESFSGVPTLDHFWGVAREESLESCWALRADCHRRKTDSVPSKRCWLTRFVIHCREHDYWVQESKALADAEWAESKARAAP